MRKKGWSWEWNLENDDSSILPALQAIPLTQEASLEGCQEAFEKLNGPDQKDLWKDDNVLACVNTSMVNTSITLSLGPTLAIVNADESQKVGEELQGIKPPTNVFSSYNFVGRVERKSIE